MPELPEVESLRQSLESVLVGRQVAAARLHRADFLHGATNTAPSIALLKGQHIRALQRRGKQMAILSDAGRVLVVHLGMTGQILVTREKKADDPHVHAEWTLNDGHRVLFRDPRRFGGLWSLKDASELASRWSALGPDALSVPASELHRRASGSRRAIKAVLLDQAVIAGIGNIYADESLFLAGIRPSRAAHRLSKAEYDRLAPAILHVLSQAIAAKGSTLRDYRDASGQPGSAQLLHKVYGRGGKPCAMCGKPLADTLLAQRTTVYCRACQH